VWKVLGYNHSVVKSLAHKGLEQYFLASHKTGIQPQHANRTCLIQA
jgi:hypothetical protein